MSSNPTRVPDAASSYVSWYGGKRRQSWATPPALFDPLHEEYGFTLDGASEPGNGLLPRSSTAEAPMSWAAERVFCNPPWSNIRPFVELAASADLAVLLVPARTNCRWFHRALDLGATVRYFKPKPKFVGAPHVSPVDCVLLVFEKEAIVSQLDDGRSAAIVDALEHYANHDHWSETTPGPEVNTAGYLSFEYDGGVELPWEVAEAALKTYYDGVARGR